MRPSISQSDLKILLHEADLAARRLCRQLRLPHQELADLRQEFLLDLIARLPAFDPKRGSLGAFAGTVMANRATRIAWNVACDRRLYGIVPVSLDEALPNGGGATRGDITSEEQGLAAVLGQPVNGFAQVEGRIDLERGLGKLGPEERALAAARLRSSAHRLAQSGMASRSGLYRRLRDLRLVLVASGLAIA